VRITDLESFKRLCASLSVIGEFLRAEGQVLLSVGRVTDLKMIRGSGNFRNW